MHVLVLTYYFINPHAGGTMELSIESQHASGWRESVNLEPSLSERAAVREALFSPSSIETIGSITS